MVSENKTPIRRVMSTNGRYWHTNAQGAADYLFNPVFMTFFILCVVLYATLMQPSEETSLPIPAQMILWGGLIMTSLIWLTFSVWASVVAHDRGLLKALYTPLILLPLVFINSFMGEFVLSVFNEDFQGSYGSMLENIVQNSIILLAFDIMHARFVAPQHPRYVSRQVMTQHAVRPTEWKTEPETLERSSPARANPEASMIRLSETERSEATQSHLDACDADLADSGCPTNIVIAREKIDASAIVWVKSEDHYLSVQMRDRNLMLRGKLSTAVDKLGDQLGFQINRSVWVAYDAIRTVYKHNNGNVEVHLDDETIYRVSSARRLLFIQNHERMKTAKGIEHVS